MPMTRKLPSGARKDLKDVDDSNIGKVGSPTQIAKASDKVSKGAGEKKADLARPKQWIISSASFRKST
jgi:hypothetical protein